MTKVLFLFCYWLCRKARHGTVAICTRTLIHRYMNEQWRLWQLEQHLLLTKTYLYSRRPCKPPLQLQVSDMVTWSILPSVSLPICWLIHPSARPSIHPSVHPSVHPKSLCFLGVLSYEESRCELLPCPTAKLPLLSQWEALSASGRLPHVTVAAVYTVLFNHLI